MIKKIRRELKQAPNLALAFVFFCAIAAASYTVATTKKEPNKLIDLAIAGLSICGFIFIFFLFRSHTKQKRKRIEETRSMPMGYYNPDEPFGC